jgi:hypothetical protein
VAWGCGSREVATAVGAARFNVRQMRPIARRSIIAGICVPILILAVIGALWVAATVDAYGIYRESHRIPSPSGDLDLIVLEGTGFLFGAIHDYSYEVYVLAHGDRVHRMSKRGLVFKTAEGTFLNNAKWSDNQEDFNPSVDLDVSPGLVLVYVRRYNVPVGPYNHKVGKVRVKERFD